MSDLLVRRCRDVGLSRTIREATDNFAARGEAAIVGGGA